MKYKRLILFYLLYIGYWEITRCQPVQCLMRSNIDTQQIVFLSIKIEPLIYIQLPYTNKSRPMIGGSPIPIGTHMTSLSLLCPISRQKVRLLDEQTFPKHQVDTYEHANISAIILKNCQFSVNTKICSVGTSLQLAQVVNRRLLGTAQLHGNSIVTFTAEIANMTLKAGMHALQLHTIIMHATRLPISSRQSGLRFSNE